MFYLATTIPGAPFWSILFFIMMIVLGMDTMVWHFFKKNQYACKS